MTLQVVDPIKDETSIFLAHTNVCINAKNLLEGEQCLGANNWCANKQQQKQNGSSISKKVLM